MDFLDYYLITLGAGAGVVSAFLPRIVRAMMRRADRLEEERTRAEDAPRAGARALEPVLVEAWRDIRRAGYRPRGLELLQLSACIEKAREGDPRITPAAAAAVLAKFPQELTNKYIKSITNKFIAL